jgi:thioredoxin reductase (NADPH)
MAILPRARVTASSLPSMDGWYESRRPGPQPLLFLESSHPGVFVAGDVRHGSIKRVASAVGEGAMAIALAHSYLATLDSGR